MGKKNTWNRKNMESRGNHNLGKTMTKGFGIVRMLTRNSEQVVFHTLDEAGLSDNIRPRSRLHVTVIGFMGMSKREQAAFNAGFSVVRLEERLENGGTEQVPRTSLDVTLGSFALAGNVLYSELQHEQLANEQTHLAGQVALHGINIDRINKKVVPPHLAVGVVQSSPAIEICEQAEEALYGAVVALDRWKVYPDRYA